MTPESAAVVVATISVVGSTAGVLITTRAHRTTRAEVRDNTAKTESVLEQVANDHTSNFRDDVDQLQADVSALGSLFAHLHNDVRDSIRHGKERDAATALIVHELQRKDVELQRRDEELAAQIRAERPDPPD